jgi:hypothetical protein
MSYVVSNPIKHVDPTGHLFEEGGGDVSCALKKTCSEVAEDICEITPHLCNNNQSGGAQNRGRQYSLTIDTQDLANFVPGSSGFYSSIATALDTLALAHVGFWSLLGITAFGIGYSAGATFGGGPVAPPGVAAGLIGLGIVEISAQPFLLANNFVASAATYFSIISDLKSGDSNASLSISVGSQGASVNYSATLSSSYQIGVASTSVGWAAQEVFLSTALQSVATASDYGLVSTPWGSLNIGFSIP